MQARVAPPVTMIDVFVPDRRLIHNVGLIVAFSLLIGLSARIAILLPFTPVPITMQTLTVLLTGMLLGSRLGALTLVAYLIEGALGLPVFSPGVIGVGAFLGPTGGYLIGFAFAAALVGFLAERGWDRRATTTLLAMVLGNLVIYTFGVGFLTRLMPLPASIAAGLVPFLVGDVVKILLAMAALPLGWSFLRRD